MTKIFFLLCLFSLDAFATWQVDVILAVDGETFKVDQTKFEDSKESVLTLGRYVLKMTIKKPKEEKGLDVKYMTHEKQGQQLILVNKGDEIIELGENSNDIFAKGEPKQPNSIITLKFKSQ